MPPPAHTTLQTATFSYALLLSNIQCSCTSPSSTLNSSFLSLLYYNLLFSFFCPHRSLTFDFYWPWFLAHSLFPFTSDFCTWFSFLNHIKPGLQKVCPLVKLAQLSRSHCLAGELNFRVVGTLGPQRKAAAYQHTGDMSSQFSLAFLLNTKDHHVPAVKDNNIMTFFINNVVEWNQLTLRGRKIPECPVKWLKMHQISRWFKTMLLEQAFRTNVFQDFFFLRWDGPCNTCSYNLSFRNAWQTI